MRASLAARRSVVVWIARQLQSASTEIVIANSPALVIPKSFKALSVARPIPISIALIIKMLAAR
jgi:hypothetical protein